MSTLRSGALSVAVMALAVATLFRDAWFSPALRYTALAFLLVDLILRIGSGYLRRRPHWTPDSWRRYLLACAVPLVALLFIVGIAVAIDMRLPFVGASRSALRAAWVGAIVLGLVVGGIGLSLAVSWLHDGEPSSQFALPRWLTRRPRSSVSPAD